MRIPFVRFAVCLLLLQIAISAPPYIAQVVSPDAGDLYARLKAFNLSGKRTVKDLTVRRDRAELTFTGTFFFQEPIDGKVYGAVFVGEGRFRAEAPNSVYERASTRRLLGEEVVESDFKTAVIRSTDDFFEQLGPAEDAGGIDAVTARLASQFESIFVRDTGVNVSARLAVSILNKEKPGFFIAEFDGGRRKRFSMLLDFQGRIPTANFAINAGEKGLIFSDQGAVHGLDIWTAFFAQEDYERGMTQYSDAYDLVDIPNYRMNLDVRDPGSALKLEAQIDVVSKQDGLRAIPFSLGESLSEFENQRLNKAIRIKSARLPDGAVLKTAQEDWEGGLTVFLPAPADSGEKLSLILELEGQFLFRAEGAPNCYYPLINTEWYPRHGYLKKSMFDLTFLHRKDHTVAGVGLVDQSRASEDGRAAVTRWRTDTPVFAATFGVGLFERFEDKELKVGGNPVEFYAVRGARIKEDFITAEMRNAIEYFSALFGAYPYPRISGVHHFRNYGQGFPGLLLIPTADTNNPLVYSFIAHEAAHQWWGHIVTWRSYRDQWLSEGFAEYSGILYTGLRDKPSAANDLIEEIRRDLLLSPETRTGLGKGRVADVGPIVLGHRLFSGASQNAYQTLIYGKGALVLRMLHHLFSDPATGNDSAFFAMMTDFVNRHRNSMATTESFAAVAGEHFSKSPIGRQSGLTDLRWFFQEWVYEAHLPAYRLEYRIEEQPDRSVVVQGTLYQDDVPEGFFMPVPLHIRIGNSAARSVIYASRPETPFTFKLPQRPDRVDLDPDLWIASSRIDVRRR